MSTDTNTSEEEGISFEDAVAEIETIVKKIQSEKSLDSLVEDVRKAKTLIAICEKRILQTEAELNEILGVDSRES